ncbi:MAG: DNA-processing protein DprA [Gammaproteobacteria bacterium]|nr:DNA-processing protein DprA [Gammaproteobacteria bacterium]
MELKFSLALLRVSGIGPVTFNQLVEKAGSAEAVYEMAATTDNPLQLSPAILSSLNEPDFSDLEPVLEWSEQEENHILTQQHPDFPYLLRQLPDAPPLLYIKGRNDILRRNQLAIVGSRNPTHAGRQAAFEFAEQLARCELTITSGLALGIDTAAHEGALAAQGHTIAVMGTGLKRIYPASNRQLAHRIASEGGVLISEFPLDAGPAREHFPRRNRIISGMSLGTLVVEAARQSGSLITARLAAEQGREVFAMPGSIHNPLARGCHALIREGAKLVETAPDILEEICGKIGITPASNQHDLLMEGENNPPSTLDKQYHSVLTCVGFEPTAVDTVVIRSGLPAPQISSMLLVLELQGFIQAQTGGLYSRIK